VALALLKNKNFKALAAASNCRWRLKKLIKVTSQSKWQIDKWEGSDI
jgi:hypothetical protein